MDDEPNFSRISREIENQGPIIIRIDFLGKLKLEKISNFPASP